MKPLCRFRYAALMVFACAMVMGFIPGCGGGGGGGGGTTPVPAADTTAPAIAFSYPAANAEFTAGSLPQYAGLAYSDASGVDPASLTVTLTLNGRTLDLTTLFARDPVQNASTSRTDSADTNPLYRTSVSRFSRTDTGFSATPSVGTVPRGSASAMGLTCLGSGSAMLWSQGGSSVYVLSTSGAFSATPVDLGFAPVVVEAASDTFYAARSGFNQLFVYDASTYQLTGIVTLPDEPARLAYHPETGKLFISYKNASTLRVSRLDTASGLVDQTINVSYTPVLLATRRGDATEGAFVVGAEAGAFRMFEYSSAGVYSGSALLGLTQPSDMAFDPAGYVYLSRFDSDSVTRVRLSDNATSDVAVGRYPRDLFPINGGNLMYVVNSGAKSISRISASGVSAATAFSPLPLAGLADCGASYTFVAEDVWDLDTRAAGTLTASIKDKAGNTGTTSITLYFSPEPVVPLRVAANH